jgi:cytochrome b subunit of formate dehydrogenase
MGVGKMKAEFLSWIRSICGGLVVFALCIMLVPAAIIAALVAVVLGFLGFLDTKKDTPKG